MLNIDTTATTMIEAGPVLSYLLKQLKLASPEDLSAISAHKIAKLMKGVRFEVSHLQYPRKYTCSGVARCPANEDFFEAESGRTSVAEYFLSQYRKRLQFPRLFCLKAGVNKPVSLPMELCTIVPGQRYKGILSGRQRKGIVDATCKRPRDRLEAISVAIPTDSDDPTMRNFELSVEPNMQTAAARVLPPPRLCYKEARTGKESVVAPRDGSWNLRDKALLGGSQLSHWILFVVAPERAVSNEQATSFVAEMRRECPKLGVRIDKNPVGPIRVHPDNLENALRANIENKVPRPQLLFFILADDNKAIYGKVKRLCDTKAGIVSQCVLAQNLQKGMQYLANLSLKLNLKLGGQNLRLESGLPNCPRGGTMVVGADVHHPSAMNQDSPSIAAVVASIDPDCCRYAAQVRPQRHRQEIIQELDLMFAQLLKAFWTKNKKLPSQIIFFRDGVGEGMYDEALSHELQCLRVACSTVPVMRGYAPKITFVICQKRIHLRIFPQAKDADKTGNVPSGTVVDTEVCSPTEFDFFMVSHGGLKGTSKPTHYLVVHDDNNFTADQMHELVFRLCHMFARCTRTVSIPAPAYFAHLAAYRGHFYAAQDDDFSDTASQASASSQVSCGSVKETLTDVMFFT